MSVDSPLSPFREDLLTGRRAVVTGGTSGIGLEVAQALSSLGAEVVSVGSRPAPDTEDARPRSVQADVRDPAALRGVFDAFEHLDILVCAAGISAPQREYDDQTFAHVVDVNLTGTMRAVLAARPALVAARGCVITVGSALSFTGAGSLPAYTASKTGVVGLTRALADELARDRVRVNCVCPGYVRTPMTAGLQEDERAERRLLDRTPLGDWTQPADLAAAVAFLASPAAAFVTGSTLVVDGGLTAVSR